MSETQDTVAPGAGPTHNVQPVVSNLLENSLKFTSTGGPVWLTVAPARWYPERNVPSESREQAAAVANAARVTVSGTGPRIPSAYGQEIFNDFIRPPQRGDSSNGAGLGLAIARRLLQALDGKVWVESEISAGSEFYFLLLIKPLEPQPSNGKT